MRLSFSLGSLLDVYSVLNCVAELAKKEPDTIWIPETWGAENFSMLSAVAAKTSTAKIGSSIINIYSRSPALIGMGAVTIDTLSQGRLILGLGTSSPEIVENFHGYAFERPVSRMREYVEIIRLVTSGRQVDYEGRFFHLRNFTPLTRPPRDRIPIYLAAVNHGMVDLAWEVADGTILYLRPRSEMSKTIQVMQSKRRIDVACQIITAVSDDAEDAIWRAKKTLSFYVAVGGIYRRFLADNGYKKETEAVLEEYQRSGLKNIAHCIPDAMLHDLTICGTPEETARRMEEFLETGVDLPIIQFNPVGDIKDSFRLLQRTFSEMQ